MEDTKSTLSEKFDIKIEKYRDRIDSALFDELDKFMDSPFHNPLQEALEGGKRIRPVILVLSYKCVDGRNNNPYPAAAAVEFAHMESLIHDDIIDQDKIRREGESFHIANEKEMAILSADFILSIILEIVSCYDDSKIPKTLSLAASRMCEGELNEILSYRQGESIDMDQYLEIIQKKTAILFEISAEIGAIIGSSNQKDIENLSQFGRLVGMSYQIEDDLYDLKMKERYNILNLLKTKKSLRKFLKEKSKKYRKKAKNKLNTLEKNEYTQALHQIADNAKPHYETTEN